MPTRTCQDCQREIRPEEVVQQIRVTWPGGGTRAVVCLACRDGLSVRAWRRRRGRTLYLPPVHMDEPIPCVTCGLSVILPTDKRRKVNACSDACRSRYYEQRETSVAQAVTHPCQGCGSALAGRSDRAYCSNACRQRAYRRRIQ